MVTELCDVLASLDSEGKQALEKASAFCMRLGHRQVTAEHLLLQLLDDPKSSLHVRLAESSVDSLSWIKTLLKRLESFDSGHRGNPIFAARLLDWLEHASAISCAEAGKTGPNQLIASLVGNALRFGLNKLPELQRLSEQDWLNNRSHSEQQLIEQNMASPDISFDDIDEPVMAVDDTDDVKTEIFSNPDFETQIDLASTGAGDAIPIIVPSPVNFEVPGYEIIKKIGAGGMANVYLARHLGLERDVALKILASAFNNDADFGERFLREARIVAKLAHPNIIQIYDVNQTADLNYLAMEYVPGGELTDQLKSGLSLVETIDVLIQVLSALSSAHDSGYIHRDIKPANILFRDNGSAVLTDFGIARTIGADTGMTMSGTLLGTPSYMSPEQARGEKLDHRSDLYSIGVLFYQMLEGKVPYKGESAMGTAMRHITDPIPSMTQAFLSTQSFVDKAMAKNVEDRFQQGSDMITALQTIKA